MPIDCFHYRLKINSSFYYFLDAGGYYRWSKIKLLTEIFVDFFQYVAVNLTSFVAENLYADCERWWFYQRDYTFFISVGDQIESI